MRSVMRKEVLRVGLGIAALAVVLYGAGLVLKPFVRPLAWAAILGAALWPVYHHLRRLLPRRDGTAAFIMTVASVALVVAPLTGLGALLVREVEPIAEAMMDWAQRDEIDLPTWIERIPRAPEAIEEARAILAKPDVREEWIRRWAGSEEAGSAAARAGRALARNLLELALTIFTLFFVFRDGEKLVIEVGLLLDRIAGGRGKSLLLAVRNTVRAVIYGWLLTAAAQGLIAMVGYWIAGLGAPVSLGFATGLAAVVPFGISLVWIPVAAGLIAEGAWLAALFVTIWSTMIVGLVDNFLRPYVISGPSRVPFVLVFFGLLGGLASFGVLGVFVGPVLLAVLLALWRAGREALSEVSVNHAGGATDDTST